eukprot:9494533-Pyramimonas_sp.AAC.1
MAMAPASSPSDLWYCCRCSRRISVSGPLRFASAGMTASRRPDSLRGAAVVDGSAVVVDG